MKTLVACEFSGIVRDAFAARGHDAWSCDLLPTEKPGQHIQSDAIEVAYGQHWDLMIAHPPCTFLTLAANGVAMQPERQIERRKAIKFVDDLWNAPIKAVCIENPIGILGTQWKPPGQIFNRTGSATTRARQRVYGCAAFRR